MEIIETSNAILSRNANNVVCLKFPNKTTHSLKTMKEHLKAVNDLDQTNTGVLLLVYMANLVGMSKESRTMVSNTEMTNAHKAVAMIVTNPLTKLIASFFLGLNKPNFPIRSFTSKDEAVAWLLKQS
jgi:ribosomal protein S24E